MIDGVKNLATDDAILRALREDVTSEDLTTAAILQKPQAGSAKLICKQNGIVAGLWVFERVFALLDHSSAFVCDAADGDAVHAGDVMGTVTGDMRALLTGERTALNFLQRMSGIATLTHSWVQELQGTRTQLLDTRKTTPNLRLFEKYAVRVGGGRNHRHNLSDGILIKDNHIGAAGSIGAAVQAARIYAPFVRKIEVEVETLAMLEEALEAGADIIMLDNMDTQLIRQAVELTAGRAELGCSGNVTRERLKELAETGVDYISCGALTHSAPILDFSLKQLRPDQAGYV